MSKLDEVRAIAEAVPVPRSTDATVFDDTFGNHEDGIAAGKELGAYAVAQSVLTVINAGDAS